jgi:hypothetical protein
MAAPARWLAGLVLAGVLVLAGCAPVVEPDATDASAVEVRHIALARKLTLAPTSPASEVARSRAACAELKGTYRADGRARYLHCILTFSDAGKACSDGGDCKGDCYARPDDAWPGALLGVCQATTSPFGCHSKVEQGKVVGGICVD